MPFPTRPLTGRKRSVIVETTGTLLRVASWCILVTSRIMSTSCFVAFIFIRGLLREPGLSLANIRLGTQVHFELVRRLAV